MLSLSVPLLTEKSMQSLMYEASGCYETGQFKNSYDLYIQALFSAVEELSKLKFVDQCATENSLSLIFSLANACLSYANQISLYKKKTPPPLPTKPTSLSSFVPLPPPLPPRNYLNPKLSKEKQNKEKPLTKTNSIRAKGVKPLVIRRSSSPSLVASPTIQYDKILFLSATQQIQPRVHARSLTDSNEAPWIPQAALDTVANSLQQQSLGDGSEDQLRQLQTIHVFSILQCHPMLIAYQLTLIDSAIFRHITPEALRLHTPKEPNPSIVASTDFFNYLTRLIEHSILIKLEATDRSQLLNYWIKVASRCHELRNYQTLKAIISALGTPPLQRLKLSWSFVPKKTMHLLEDMAELMSETANYEKYRLTALQTVRPTEPMVPFLGTFLHDMTYLHALNNPEHERIKDLRSLFIELQQTPIYAAELPAPFLKEVSAYHRPRFSLRSSVAKKSHQEEDFARLTIDLQQCLVSHYLLTRPWVTEKAVDELSVQREPAKGAMTSSVSLTTTRSSTSSTTSNSTGPSRPLSLEDEDDFFDKKTVPGFRLFGRKSTDRPTEAPTLQRSPRYFSLDEIHKSEEKNSQLPPIFRKEFWKNNQNPHRFSIISYNSDPALSTTHQNASHPLDPDSFIWS